MPIAIGVAIASALIGSFVLTLTSSTEHESVIDLQEKCYKIAMEGFKIQVKYPNLTIDEIPQPDNDSLQYLDDIWYSECVSQLTQEKILEIAQSVQKDYSSSN
ncbi:MAG: hypothetical protein R3327_04645 [Nitrosopumilaceae archaeon]|nr:hypothetical protein [Nitrosopumilaceae archaeon]